ncbi:major capsid protein [Mycobacterium phage Wilkins]|uniref:Major capsid protein n=1 Tax=Mycobacterium phage Violet TaxID=1086800 RepID=G3MEJ9_9CAUD|nr:major capsid protein [Mycobacterium phage Violet]AOQ29372.1 major capsid protein [Mycobacterium phage Bigfoot]AOZ64055.1 major capsid protein [Mycobacterium phage CactusRose]ATW59800.1 major capsid protein [Mycobacterium phage Wilkins]AXC33662.1 major capsid protein [Mycobacterium phage Mryolo]AZF98183.1 major capsid protein [Mycobacterium phage Bones]QOI67066.1 major capsid protein [Mycobacterium phage Topgun]
MATLGELAPDTAGSNHQGRLAHVPSDLLPKEIVGPIFDKAQESSLVLRMGEMIPISYGETIIPTTVKRPEVGQVGVGTSNEQREGGVKPLSGTAWDTRSVSPIKLATIVTVSEEFARMNPSGLYTKLQGDLAYAIGRGIDLAVFHGKSPLTGSALQGIDTDNVIANTTNVDYLQEAGDPLLDRLLDGYDLVSANTDVEFNAWAVDPRFRAHLLRSQAYRDANGNVDPSRINLAAMTGDVLGLPAQFGRAVGGDLGAATDTKTRIVGGDFSQLKFGFADEIRVKMSDTATLTDANSKSVSMWQTNQIAILIEVTFGWLLGDKQAFVKFVDDTDPN